MSAGWRRLPFERRLAGEVWQWQRRSKVSPWRLVGEDGCGDVYWVAPWWIAWLWRLVPRFACWHPPEGVEPGQSWMGPAIAGTRWSLGVVRNSQSENGRWYVTGTFGGREVSWRRPILDL